MDIAATKLDLTQRVMSIGDKRILQRVSTFLKKEVPEAREGSDDVTEEEMAELEKRYQDMVSGRVKGIPEKDAIRMIREGTKG